MRFLCLCILLVLSACKSSERAAEDDATPRYTTTLCIENATAGYGELIARAGTQRYRVSPGKEVCKELFVAQNQIVLQARTQGGGARGPLSFRSTLNAMGGCWRWEVSNNQGAILPCRTSE